MDERIECKVLDHGFVKIRNLSGQTPANRVSDLGSPVFAADDTDPAKSARMSFDNMDEERTRDQDVRLAGYLMRNGHNTPIEMVECWIEMKMPIFVARQFVRHRTACINEVSARYVTLPREWYIPETVGAKAANVKQGQVDGLETHLAMNFKTDLDSQCAKSYGLYAHHLSKGVAPEHARLFLHVNHYTHWLWKQDLHNLMHFLSLRVDSHAQVEAQLYAKAIVKLLRNHLPELMGLYDIYRTRS